MDNITFIRSNYRPQLKLWVMLVAATTLVALSLNGVEIIGRVSGVRRTFTMMIMPYTIVVAGILGPLLYFAINHFQSKWQLSKWLIGIIVFIAVMLSSYMVGWTYFMWFISAPMAPQPIWTFLSRELFGISLPFWLVLLVIWLWYTRKQITALKQQKSDYIPTKEERPIESISATYGQNEFVLRVADIQFIKAEGNYSKIFSGERFYMKNTSLKKLESLSNDLIRIHKSVIANLSYVASLRPAGHGDLTVILQSGQELKCSRNYSAALKSRLQH